MAQRGPGPPATSPAMSTGCISLPCGSVLRDTSRPPPHPLVVLCSVSCSEPIPCTPSPGCAAQRNFCDGTWCQNGGTCVSGWNTYLCECPLRFGGKNCEQGESWRGGCRVPRPPVACVSPGLGPGGELGGRGSPGPGLRAPWCVMLEQRPGTQDGSAGPSPLREPDQRGVGCPRGPEERAGPG